MKKTNEMNEINFIFDIVKDYAERKDIILDNKDEKTAKQIILRTIHSKNEFVVSSEQMCLNSDSLLLISKITDNDFCKNDNVDVNFLVKFLENNTKNKYTQCEIVFIVQSIENKINITNNIAEIKKIIKHSRFFSDIIVKCLFQQIELNTPIEIRIDSSLQSIIYSVYEESTQKTEEMAYVYTAYLYDLVELYNNTGDVLFKENVRFKIGEQLDVEAKIKETLKTEPELFWLKNNGISMIVQKSDIDNCFQKKIVLTSTKNVSIINGAQTITTAAEYYYSTRREEKKNTPKVLLRVILTNENKKADIKDISIALNRQKAIKESDIRYMEKLSGDINYLYEKNKRNAPYFAIEKEGETLTRGITISEFIKSLAIVVLQKPGKARASKNSIIKDNEYWEKYSLLGDNGEISEEKFRHNFSAIYSAWQLFEQIERLAKMKKDQKFENWYKFAKEFFVSYMICSINDGNDDFSKFPAEMTDKIKRDDTLIIKLFDDFADNGTKWLNGRTMESNITKIDSEYLSLKSFLDKEKYAKKIRSTIEDWKTVDRK